MTKHLLIVVAIIAFTALAFGSVYEPPRRPAAVGSVLPAVTGGLEVRQGTSAGQGSSAALSPQATVDVPEATANQTMAPQTTVPTETPDSDTVTPQTVETTSPSGTNPATSETFTPASSSPADSSTCGGCGGYQTEKTKDIRCPMVCLQ